MLIGETAIGNQPGIGDSFIVRTKTYTMDDWIIFTGGEPIEDPPGTIRYSMNRMNDILLKKTVLSQPTFDLAIGRNAILSTYSMNVGLLNALAGASFDIFLRPSYDATIPSTSVIDALVWSYAELLDGVWRQMETMSNALKLEHAQGSDLDDAWGEIYDLPRIYGEDDVDYRDRLKTRTSIIKSSGTKSSCETIIDNILGDDITVIESRYPGTVYISFSNDENMRLAKSRKTLLDILIPQMLATGISYNLLLPIMDYNIIISLMGPLNINLNSDMMLCHEDTETSYDMYINSRYQSNPEYYMYFASANRLNKELLIGQYVKIPLNKTITSDNIIKKVFIETLLTDMIIKRNFITASYTVDQYIKKCNINKLYYMDELSKRSITRRSEMNMILVAT